MSNIEEVVFRSFASRARNYLEFGCGGSTIAASALVSGKIVSVDSSPVWMAKVAEELAVQGTGDRTDLFAADIGELTDWGYPANTDRKYAWPAYHTSVWHRHDAKAFDLFLVDGRFRVACFFQIVLRCRPQSVILVHDYPSRPQYRPVESAGVEICRAGELSAFLPRSDLNHRNAEGLVEQFRYDPA